MRVAESMDGQHFDVVVIGAGVAGSMAGLLSARAGLRTLLVDRQKFPRSKVCGCCLNGRAVGILQQAGLETGLRGLHPGSTTGLAIRHAGQQLDVRMPTSAAVSRKAFDQWLINEAISSGCRFADDVSAAVVPEACDAVAGAVKQPSHTASECPEHREVELCISGTVPQENRNAPNEASGSSTQRVIAKVVLVCDGLGHPSLHRIPAFRATPKAGSRIGLGAVFPRTPADEWIRQGKILMAVAPHGYAGIVEIEDGQLNLAAAIDPGHLHQTKSPLRSLESLFQAAGVPMPQELTNAAIKGTVPLTRRAEKIAGHRIFLLGDATGYVEPFTGEGMAWALTSASAIVPIVSDAVRTGWETKMMSRWQTTFRNIVGREQRICRFLSAVLKRPWILPPIMTTCRFFPSVTRHLVSRINRLPEAPGVHG